MSPLTPLPWYRHYNISLPWCRHRYCCHDTATIINAAMMPRLMPLLWYRHRCCYRYRCHNTAAAAAMLPPLTPLPWYRRLLPWCRHFCRCRDTAAAAVVVMMPLLPLPCRYRHLHHCHDTAAVVISIIHHCYRCREGGCRDLCRCRDTAAATVAIVAMIPSLIISCWIVVKFVRSNRFLIASIIVVFVHSW